jgi:hypothetical protein
MPSWKKVIVSGSDAALNSLTVTNGITGSNIYSSQNVEAAVNLRSLNSSGDEGGEIFLNKAVTNTTLTGGVTIDVWQNRLRFFEQGGTARGYFLDISSGSAGASTNLASGGGTVTSVGGTGTVNGLTLSGNVSGSGNLTLGGTLSNILTSSLAQSGSTIGSTFVGLGSTVTTLAGLTSVTATNFTGTASYATSASQAITASYANFALTTSNAQNAQDILIYVKNVTGAQINKGKVVRISGATGDNALISTASYENDPVSANTLGITNQDIPHDSFGYVITEGTLIGINTNAFVAGQLLYLGAAGSIIGTAPVAPLHAVRLGQVLRVQTNNGSIYVRIDNGYELGELHDVVDSSTTSSYGDLLVKSGSVWINSRQLTGSYGLTGSLNATSFTGSLFGTSSYATSASQAINATTSTQVIGTVTGTNTTELVRGNMADNDQFRILVGGTATNAGYVELATADDGTEPIYVRQYTGVFSSLARTATLLDGSGNTQFPGSVSASSFLGPLTGTSSYATSASQAISSSFAINASSSLFAVSSSRAVSSSFATLAATATSASYATIASSSLFATNASSSLRAISSSFATLAATATNATTATTANSTVAAATFNNAGSGDASGTTFNGGTARTISYNTVGAPSTSGTNATGTWGISITGNALTATSASFATNASSSLFAVSSSRAVSASYATVAQSVLGTITNANTASNITPAITNTANNRVLTDNGGGTINAESNLTFDGGTLRITGSLIQGDSGFVNSFVSHAEGEQTYTEGYASHAEGVMTSASGDYSHAEGEGTLAKGYASHAEGGFTFAGGDYSHAAGIYTSASADYQSVIGMSNKPSPNQGAFIIGNGTGPGTESNLLYASGSNVQITGSLYVSRSDNDQLSAIFATRGSKTNPAYTFIGDEDTGMFRDSANTLGLTAGSQIRLIASDTQLYLNPGTTAFQSNILTISDDTIPLVSKTPRGNVSVGLSTSSSYIEVTDTTTGTGPYYLMFADGTTGYRTTRVDSSTLTFNATTNTLTVANLTGNASTATTLATARNINGTSFNGSADITTANWGTSRTITIGSTGKSVNGSGNVSWSLAEIGAQATLTNPVTGTGVDNQVAVWSGTTTQDSNANLTFDGSTLTTTGIRGGNGSASTPAFSFSGDTNTGMYNIGADTLGFATAGGERIRIDSSGNCGIGGSPATRLDVQTSGTTQTSILGRGSDGNFRLTTRQDVSTNTDGSIIGELGIDYTTTRNSAIRFHRGASTTGGFMSFTTNDGTERVRINSTGNVGIGTSSPVDKLDVTGAIRFRVNTPSFTAAPDSGVLDFVPTSIFPTDPQIRLVAVGTSTVGASIAFQTGLNSGSIAEAMRITSGGFVGVGMTNPTYKLQVNDSIASVTAFGNFTALQSIGGTGYRWSLANDSTFRLQYTTNGFSSVTTPLFVTSNGALGLSVTPTNTQGRFEASNDIVAFSTSDKRWKNNIVKIDSPLEKISQISGVEFDWIEDEPLHGNKGHDVGVIAQEIELVIPEAVQTRESGMKAVQYDKIIPLLIESIKEQQKQIDELKELVNKLTK